MLTPDDVYNADFARTWRRNHGYDEDEVDDFLDRVDATLSGEDTVTAHDVLTVRFSPRQRGGRAYKKAQVDAFLDKVALTLMKREVQESGAGEPPKRNTGRGKAPSPGKKSARDRSQAKSQFESQPKSQEESQSTTQDRLSTLSQAPTLFRTPTPPRYQAATPPGDPTATPYPTSAASPDPGHYPASAASAQPPDSAQPPASTQPPATQPPATQLPNSAHPPSPRHKPEAVLQPAVPEPFTARTPIEPIAGSSTPPLVAASGSSTAQQPALDKAEVDAFVDRVEATLRGEDTLTAQEVLNVRFSPPGPGRPGYQEASVVAFLVMVSTSIKQLSPREQLAARSRLVPEQRMPIASAFGRALRKRSPQLTPDAIRNVVLGSPGSGDDGYNEDEVDGFLDRVEATLRGTDRMTSKEVSTACFRRVPAGFGGYDREEVDALLGLIQDRLDTDAVHHRV